MKRLICISLLMLTISCGKDSSTPPHLDPPQEPTTQTSDETRRDPLKHVELQTADGGAIQTTIASSAKEQSQGLQGVKENEFSADEGMLFFYLEDDARTFWMPNTYFNLDIFYLDENMTITDVVWNMPHYTGNTRSEIPRAPRITSRHVLEMKAGSPISSKLSVGDTLKWNSSLSLKETETRIRQRQSTP